MKHHHFSLPHPPELTERNHVLLLVAFSFLLGCLSVLYMDTGAWLWGLAAGGAVLALLFWSLERQAGIALAICFFALGALRADAAMTVTQPHPGTYEINGVVYGGAASRTDNRIAFTLGKITLDGEAVPGFAYCSLHYEEAPPELFDGAEVRFSGRVYLPEGKSGEPHTDFRMWMLQRGLSFGVAAYQEVTVANTPDTAAPADLAYRIRAFSQRSLERIMGENVRVAMAMVFGQRDGLTEEENDAFATLGIAHLMSVSGLHVSILGGLLLEGIERLRKWRKLRLPRWFPLAALSVLMLVYCAVTGFSAAANRAAVMLLMYTLARLWLRWAERVTVLAAAMLGVLLINPLHASSAGFVLSFSTMLAILLYAQPLGRWLNRHLFRPTEDRSKLRRRRQFCDSLSVAPSAQCGVLLPTISYFHQLPLYGVLINLFIVPLVSTVLVPLYILALPASWIPLVGNAVGFAASALTTVLLWLVNLLSALPFAAIRTAEPPAVLSLGLGMAMIILSQRVPGSFRRRLTAAALTVLIALAGAWYDQPAPLRYIQLSVGQADSALLLDHDQTVLIDAGSDGREALDYLQAEARDVDALYITHLHMDHIGGVVQLLDADIAIHQVYLPVGAERQQADPAAAEILSRLRMQGIPVTELASGDELHYNESVIHVLWPEARGVRPGHDANDLPLVLSIDLRGYTLLCASDLTGLYENYAAIPADVLKVAHHGSSASTKEAFLDFVDPAAALLSVSSGSTYHPSSETLGRLQERNIRILRTDVHGDITLTVENGNLLITPYRSED